ncbi:hypothetical protein BDV12DRAFT_191830 [Aspergillus spectabilis]
MERLPPEILHHICLLVRDISFHDLSSLSRTNRRLFSVAAPVFYRQLVINWNIVDEYAPSEDLSEIREAGLGRRYLKFTKQLDLVCHDRQFGISPSKQDSQQDEVQGAGQGDSIFLDKDLTEPLVQGLNHNVYRTGWAQETQNWAPLVSLLANLDRLAELNYYAVVHFPECLFDAMKEHQPSCRVNIWGSEYMGYQTRNLEDVHYIEPFPLDSSNYPNPKALTLCRRPMMQDPLWSGVQLGEQIVVLTETPSRQHVEVMGYIPAQQATAQPKQREPSPAYPQPILNTSLQALVLNAGGIARYADILHTIANHFDVSRLKSLHLPLAEDVIVLEKIAPAFQGLIMLSVEWHPREFFNGIQNKCSPDHSDSAIAAVQAFCPLQYFQISGLTSFKPLYKILSRHGKSLYGLQILPNCRFNGFLFRNDGGYRFPQLDRHAVRQLAKLCPSLEQLRLQVKRSMGSSEECDIYRALGGFPFLRTLLLDLHCDPRQPPINIEDQVPYREIFKNAATDADLIGGIWKLITSHQHSQELIDLRCTPFGQPFFDPAVAFVVAFIGKFFLAQRLQYPYTDSFRIIEVGARERSLLRCQIASELSQDKAVDPSPSENEDEGMRNNESPGGTESGRKANDTDDGTNKEQQYENGDENGVDANDNTYNALSITPLGDGVDQVLRDLWPENEGWRDAWESFPLQVNDTESA